MDKPQAACATCNQSKSSSHCIWVHDAVPSAEVHCTALVPALCSVPQSMVNQDRILTGQKGWTSSGIAISSRTVLPVLLDTL